MSTQGNGALSAIDPNSLAQIAQQNGLGANGAAGTQGANQAAFAAQMGPADPNSGLNSLNAGLMGPNAGTLPNGFSATNGNYTPPSSLSGVSAGSLNGNTSFTMPQNSTGQLNGQALGNLGAKIAATGGPQQKQQTGSGRVSTHAQNFQAPVADFSGSTPGSGAGAGLLKLLANYTPGRG